MNSHSPILHRLKIGIGGRNCRRHCVSALAENCSLGYQTSIHPSISTSGRTLIISVEQDNVLVDDDGGPLLCDFGISRILEKTATYPISHTTVTGGLRGTVRYMSKELLSENGSHTESSDIWAFGMTVYVSRSILAHEAVVCDLPVDPPYETSALRKSEDRAASLASHSTRRASFLARRCRIVANRLSISFPHVPPLLGGATHETRYYNVIEGDSKNERTNNAQAHYRGHSLWRAIAGISEFGRSILNR